MYAVKTTLKELMSVDPKKGIGAYGRYNELTAQSKVPEVISRTLAEVNARSKEHVETKAAGFLAENRFPVAAIIGAVTEKYRYRNISYIANVTRADETLFSILETEMESGIGNAAGEVADGIKTCVFHSHVYDTQSGSVLTLDDFMQDPGSINERLRNALANKYGNDGLYTGGGEKTPAWTADYLGLRFYFDGSMVPEEKRRETGMDPRKAVHVSIPYSALDGPMAEAAAKTPESFIAQIEKNTEYALPHDRRVLCVEKKKASDVNAAYRVVTAEGDKTESWWLEYSDDGSDYFVMRNQDKYYFFRLEDLQDRGYIYNFASPDGGFNRFANQNAQCFDSFMHELYLAVPYDPNCVHMRERSRKFMDAKSGLNTSYEPNGHYAFLPEKGRGRTWLHFSLIDDALALDSHNVGCRLLHEINAVSLDDDGKESGETVIPAGEVLRFLRVDGESELYYYMSTQYDMYKSGARDYSYECALSDARLIRLVTSYENSFFVDGMYLDRIGEPVTLGAARYEAGLGELPEHFVKIGGKKYKLIRDLSLQTESGEQIDFGNDIWWEVENYTGIYTSPDGDAKLVINGNGEVSLEYQGRSFAGRLPERRYYRRDVMIFMEAGYERRTFRIIVEDKLPAHDPSFGRIRLYSEGEPATNEPSKVPPIEVKLVRRTL
ncbi:MAG: hypothetical protein K5629_05660 [Eubacteriales bacterium]|nr:hypothetical protein [Eubacteriales bacterium]